MRPGLIAALVLFLIPQPAYRSASVGPGGSDPLPRLDEYEDLLRQSIDVWRDFRGRFKDLANLSVSQDNGETVLTGSVEAYKVKNSTFEARFAGPTQINSLAIILDPSNARDRRLRSDLSNRIAKGQPKLEDWLPSEIRDIRDNLLVERIEVRFGPGNHPTEATLFSRIQTGYQLLPAFPVRTSALEFIFTVTDPANRDRAGLVATMAGGITFGDASARLSGTIQSRDSRETWSLAAEFESVNLGAMMQGVIGAGGLSGIVLPPEVLDLSLQGLVLEMDEASNTVSARATSDLGEVEFHAETGGNGNGGTVFQLGMAPPADFAFASVAPELSVMDDLGLTNSAIVIASHPTRTDLPIFQTFGRGQDVGRGVTFMGGYDLRNASAQVADFLGVDAVIMRGTIGNTMSELDLEAKIDTRIPLVPNSNAATLRGVSIRLTPNPAGPTMELGGLIDVRADRQTLTFGADIGIDFLGPSLYIEGQLMQVDGSDAAFWSNPFGIAEGLHVRNLGLALGINFGAPIPLPIVGLQGEVVAGNLQNPAFYGTAAIGIDPADPQKSVIDVGFSELSVGQIVQGATTPEVYRSIPAELRYVMDIRLEDVRLSIVPSPAGVELFGNYYDPGFLVQGRTVIGDWSGELFLAVDYDGIEARATANAIHAEPWFALTGARGNPDPFINVVLKPGTESMVAFSGRVLALGIEGEADVLMYDQGFDVYLRGRAFGGMFDAMVEVAGGDLKNGGSLYAVAEMQNDLFQYITQHASQQIDAATRDMQAEISKAQNDVRLAQADIRRLDGEINQYRAYLEQQRNQTCLDIRNGNQDVARAQQDVANSRMRLNSFQSDPEIVQARTDLQRAEQELATARAALNNLQNDPGVVRARNDITNAERQVASANSAVANIQNDPGVRQARQRLQNAQNEVNRLNGRISALDREMNSLKRRIRANPLRLDLEAELVAKGTEWTALQAAKGTATGALTAARGVFNGSLQAAEQAAYAGLRAAEGTLQATRATYDGAIRAAQETAQFGIQTAEGTVRASRSTYDGLMQAAQQTAQLAMQAAEGTLYAAQQTAQATYDACVAAPIEIDPRLATMIASQEVAYQSLEAANIILEGVKTVATGTMVAAEWIVENGNPLGVLNVDYAKFEGCLAALEGGRVAMEFRGQFAGSPVSGALDFNFVSPMDAVSYLAEYVLNNKSGPQLGRSGGQCMKPSFVGRPGAASARGLDPVAVPGSPSDLQGAPPAIERPDRPANLGKVQAQ